MGGGGRGGGGGGQGQDRAAVGWGSRAGAEGAGGARLSGTSASSWLAEGKSAQSRYVLTNVRPMACGAAERARSWAQRGGGRGAGAGLQQGRRADGGGA